MIYLPEVKVYMYTVTRNADRQARCREMFGRLGFSNWEFVFGKESQPYWAGYHDDWIRMAETKTPFMIMEDDATATEWYKPELEYPDDAQLVYLGGSRLGDGGKRRGVKMSYQDMAGDYIRVLNMYGGHALLFVDDKATERIRKEWDLHRNVITDVQLARWTGVKYCLKKPFWYQVDGHSDEATLKYYP